MSIPKKPRSENHKAAKTDPAVHRALTVPIMKSTQSPWLSNVLHVIKAKVDALNKEEVSLINDVYTAVEAGLREVVSDKQYSIEPTQRVNLFLSYMRNDEELVTSYFDKLERSPHVNKVFIDTKSIDVGEDIAISIDYGLEDADVVLLALTARTAESKWVMVEIGKAKQRAKLLIPILLDESLLYDEELRKRLKEDKRDLLDLLNANCIRAFAMLPCEVIHLSVANAQNHSGIIGRVTAQMIQAAYNMGDDQLEIMVSVISDAYQKRDIRIFDIEQAIRVGEQILLSNKVQNDTSPEVLECLINLYLLRVVFKVGSDIETRNTYDNVIKLLFRLIHKKNPLPPKKYSFDPQKAHGQDMELLFRVAQVLIRKNKYVEAFEICEKLCHHPDISIPANMNLRSVITYTALGLAYEIEMYKEYYQTGEKKSPLRRPASSLRAMPIWT